MTKLTKKEAEAKRDYHKKREKYYSKKVKEKEREERIIGFKHY